MKQKINCEREIVAIFMVSDVYLGIFYKLTCTLQNKIQVPSDVNVRIHEHRGNDHCHMLMVSHLG